MCPKIFLSKEFFVKKKLTTQTNQTIIGLTFLQTYNKILQTYNKINGAIRRYFGKQKKQS